MDLDDTVIYKIDIPANRYDLLCIEGIARSLRIFKGLQRAPLYRLVEPAGRPNPTFRGRAPAAHCSPQRFNDRRDASPQQCPHKLLTPRPLSQAAPPGSS